MRRPGKHSELFFEFDGRNRERGIVVDIKALSVELQLCHSECEGLLRRSCQSEKGDGPPATRIQRKPWFFPSGLIASVVKPNVCGPWLFRFQIRANITYLSDSELANPSNGELILQRVPRGGRP